MGNLTRYLTTAFTAAYLALAPASNVNATAFFSHNLEGILPTINYLDPIFKRASPIIVHPLPYDPKARAPTIRTPNNLEERAKPEYQDPMTHKNNPLAPLLEKGKKQKNDKKKNEPTLAPPRPNDYQPKEQGTQESGVFELRVEAEVVKPGYKK